MLLAHKIEVRPTPEQEEKLFQWVGTIRHCYNQLLVHFSQDGFKFNKKDARSYLKDSLREEFIWYKELSQDCLRESINDLENGYKRFFKKQGGYPKFKKRGERDSFSIRDKMKFSVVGRDLRIEKFNKGRGNNQPPPLKLRERLRFEGTPKQVTISCKAGKWFASILVEVESGYNMKQPQDNTQVGVDLGVKELATLSDGTIFGKCDKLSKKLKKLEKLQQRLARQKKGSNRRAKTKQKISKLHFYVSEQRKQLLHSVSDYLTANYSTICLEDLKVSQMLEKGHKNLSRMIADVGMYELRRQVEYKSFLRGGEVKFVDQYFPSSKTCSCCGRIKEDLKLSERVYKCDCGLEIDRDLNAALNILKEGLRH